MTFLQVPFPVKNSFRQSVKLLCHQSIQGIRMNKDRKIGKKLLIWIDYWPNHFDDCWWEEELKVQKHGRSSAQIKKISLKQENRSFWSKSRAKSRKLTKFEKNCHFHLFLAESMRWKWFLCEKKNREVIQPWEKWMGKKIRVLARIFTVFFS